MSKQPSSRKDLESSQGSQMSLSPPASQRLVSSQKRLKVIEDAVKEEKRSASQKRLKEIEKAVMDWSPTPSPSLQLTPSQVRLKAIEDALNPTQSPETPISQPVSSQTSSSQKRPADPSFSQPSPKKRRADTPFSQPPPKKRPPTPLADEPTKIAKLPIISADSRPFGSTLTNLEIKVEPKVKPKIKPKVKPRAKSPVAPPPSQNAGHLDAFFQLYPNFEYDSSQPVMSQFYKMCDRFEYEDKTFVKKEAQEGVKDAIAKQFNFTYGEDVNDIRSWQNLCRVLNVPIPEGLEACRDKVLSLYVNIVDLVDSPNTGHPVKKFADVFDLSDYTIKTGKFFPKKNAYAGGVLRYLLRQIINPHAERNRTR